MGNMVDRGLERGLRGPENGGSGAGSAYVGPETASKC